MDFMNESVEIIIEKLKREYAEELVLPSSGMKRQFSLAFKRAIVSEIEKNHISANMLANKLGIGGSTICKWKRELGSSCVVNKNKAKRSPFQKLEISTESDWPLKSQQGQNPYLVGKSGVRIVGLSLNQIAELLRYL